MQVLFLGAALVLPTLTFAQNLPAIYVQQLTVDKSSYQQGDTVRGTALLVNDSSSDQPRVSYSVQLAGGYGKNGLPTKEYAQETLGPVFLAKAQSKQINFDFTLPATVAGSDLGIRVQAMLPDGTPLGWDDAQFSVAGSSQSLTVTDASVLIGSNSYGNEAGPTIHQGETGNLHIALTSQSSDSMTLTPVMTIYDRSITAGQVVGTQSFAPLTIAANGTASSTYPLPTFNMTLGVYEGTIAFNDSSGISHIQLLAFRYIVAGNIATIHNITADADSGSAGQTVNLTVSYSGNPPDIAAGQIATSSSATLSAELFDENGQSVGQASASIDMSTQTQTVLPITLTGNAKALLADIAISSGGQVLASSTAALSADYDSLRQSGVPLSSLLISVGTVIAVLLLIVLAFQLIRKRPSNSMLALLPLLLFAAFSIPGAAHAQSYTVTQGGWQPSLPPCSSYGGGWGSVAGTQCSSGQWPQNNGVMKVGEGETGSQVFINSPVTLSPGQQFYVQGSVSTPACLNSPQGLYILSSYNGANYSYQRTNGAGGNENKVNYTDQFSLGPYTAPTAPGTYQVNLGVAYYSGPFADYVSYVAGGEYGYQTFTVACPGGETNVNGQCVANTSICLDGSLAPGGNSNQCSCAHGSTSACNTCPDGSLAPNNSRGECSCALGNTKACSTCPDGSFAPHNVRSQCSCAHGNTSACSTCPDGSLAPNNVSSECSCAQGNTSACNKCPDGSVAPNNVSIECSCAQGNTLACINDLCPDGSRAPNNDRSQCSCAQGNTSACNNPNPNPPACTPTNVCSGNNLVNSCTGAVVQSCAEGCSSGSCNPLCQPHYFCSAGNLYYGDASYSYCSYTESQACTWGCNTDTSACNGPLSPQFIQFAAIGPDGSSFTTNGNLVALPTLLQAGNFTTLYWNVKYVKAGSCSVNGPTETR